MRGAKAEQLLRLAERVVEQPGDPMRRGDQISFLATFGALRFPRVNVWDLLRRSTMLSELMDELVEDSPFLRQLRDETLARGNREGREEGHLEEARMLLRQMAQARFPALTETELAPVETISRIDQLHALVLGLSAMPDAATFLRALHDAQA